MSTSEASNGYGEKQEFVIFNKVIMCLQHSPSMSGAPAINCDFGEHGAGRTYNNKESIQLSIDEAIELYACLDRQLPEVKFGYHGTNKDKMLSVTHQPNREILFSLVKASKQLYYMEIRGGQIFRAKSLLIKQIANALHLSVPDVIAMFSVRK